MKADRLYAITVYLLNHGKTSASELAKKFEVSVRTIQRDIDSLCAAGIPIVAEIGVTGGYYLTESVNAMRQIIMSWQKEYDVGNYIRWSIIKKETKVVVGTVEIAPIPYIIKFYKGCDTGILRIDLISNEETVENYLEILDVVKKEFFKDFLIKKIVFKAPQSHYNKVKALERMNFQAGKDSELPFEDYYILQERDK